MISYAAALEIIAAAVRALPARAARPADALGMVAATDVRSAVAVPSFDNAAMDGFALRSADTRTATELAPVTLAVAGRVAAGEARPGATPPGATWEIMTGAAMPADCDAVVPVERAEQTGGHGPMPAILVREPLRPGQNRRLAGEDFPAGGMLLRAGDPLTPQSAMALAAAGCDDLQVRAPPRFAIIATGSELVVRGTPGARNIRDANGPYLTASLETLRLPLSSRRVVADDPEQLTAAIAAASPAAEIVLTTGGVSAGRFDCVPAAVERMGGETLFHNVAIRPGKPLLCARLPGGTLLFGLPGNPMAVAVGLRFFVLPAVRALMGRAPEAYLCARAAEAVRKRESLTFFAKAFAEVRPDATLGVTLLPGQESFKISPLLRANCWAIVPDGLENVAAGAIIRIAPLLPADCPATSAG